MGVETDSWRERSQSFEVLALTGLAFSVLFVVSLLLLGEEPPLDAGADEIRRWFDDRERLGRTLTGLNLAPVSIVALLWFMAVLRRRLGAAEDKLFSTVFVGSGVLFSALYLSGVAAAASGAAMVEYAGREPDVPTYLLVRALGKTLLAVLAAKLGAVFVISMTSVGLRARVFTRATASIGYGLGAAMFIGLIFRRPAPFLLPAWIAVASLDLLLRRKFLREALPRPR
jgi:hypothetical protein